MKVMTANAFIEKAKEIEKECSLYVLGGIGQMISEPLIRDVCHRIAWNRHRESLYRSYIGRAYAFDCVGLIKAILWEWKPDSYNYAINGVPDINANVMIGYYCTDVSGNFSDIEVGEVVWLPDHIGIYIGDGKVIESTPAWEDGVQITNLGARDWLRHGKLQWVDYEKHEEEVSPWAKEAQDWVVAKGISDGTRPKDQVTRQEVWTMLHRMDK